MRSNFRIAVEIILSFSALCYSIFELDSALFALRYVDAALSLLVGIAATLIFLTNLDIILTRKRSKFNN